MSFSQFSFSFYNMFKTRLVLRKWSILHLTARFYVQINFYSILRVERSYTGNIFIISMCSSPARPHTRPLLLNGTSLHELCIHYADIMPLTYISCYFLFSCFLFCFPGVEASSFTVSLLSLFYYLDS